MLSFRKPPSTINRSISSRPHWSATNLAIDVFSWPDSEVTERPDDFRFLGYSGLVVLTASLSESDPERKWLRHSTLGNFSPAAFEKRAGLA